MESNNVNKSHEYFWSLIQLQQDIQVKQNEIQRETRKREKMERDLKNQKNELDKKTAENKLTLTQLQRSKDDNLRFEQQLKEQRVYNMAKTY